MSAWNVRVRLASVLDRSPSEFVAGSQGQELRMLRSGSRCGALDARHICAKSRTKLGFGSSYPLPTDLFLDPAALTIQKRELAVGSIALNLPGVVRNAKNERSSATPVEVDAIRRTHPVHDRTIVIKALGAEQAPV